jgi:hypothetical protein
MNYPTLINEDSIREFAKDLLYSVNVHRHTVGPKFGDNVVNVRRARSVSLAVRRP